MKAIFGRISGGFFMFALILTASFLAGCSSSDDDKIIVRICNLDDNEYRVELRQNSDDSVVRSFDLEEWYDLGDNCDEFQDFAEGRYYIMITDKGSGETDRSHDFYMEEGEYRAFTIDSTGSVRGDSSADDDGTILVCNNDNEEYAVELRRESDDKLLESFSLDTVFDASDRCEEFEDVDEGRYYLVIEEEDSGERSEAERFFLDGDEFENFVIDDTGSIKRR